MTSSERAADEFPIHEPSALRSLWASLTAVVAKESRWRMRGRRAFVIVTIYLSLLALLVFFVAQVMYDQASTEFNFEGELIRSDFVPGTASATIGQAIFISILFVQTLLTMLLAPGLTSGSISIEREKQTLELLITTPVSTLGMVVGKLVSSLAYVFLLIVASVPLMSIVFAFGGVAPDDVIRAYVLLLAMAVGIGSVGLFMSALFKRTQVATAIAYLIVIGLTIGTLALHTYIHVSSQRPFLDLPRRTTAPEAMLWLNPFVADVDLLCTAIPETAGGTCSYIALVMGREMDQAIATRDAFWPRSAVAFVTLAVALTLGTTQLIAPSRRIRRPSAPPGGLDEPDGSDATDESRPSA